MIKNINVDLTPMQTRVMEKCRRHLPTFSHYEFERHVVAQGILAIGADVPDEEQPEYFATSDRPKRHLDEYLTIPLEEGLRHRLEKLLNARPNLTELEVFSSLIELGLETLVELRVLGKNDISLPTESPAILAAGEK